MHRSSSASTRSLDGSKSKTSEFCKACTACSSRGARHFPIIYAGTRRKKLRQTLSFLLTSSRSKLGSSPPVSSSSAPLFLASRRVIRSAMALRPRSVGSSRCTSRILACERWPLHSCVAIPASLDRVVSDRTGLRLVLCSSDVCGEPCVERCDGGESGEGTARQGASLRSTIGVSEV